MEISVVMLLSVLAVWVIIIVVSLLAAISKTNNLDIEVYNKLKIGIFEIEGKLDIKK